MGTDFSIAIVCYEQTLADMLAEQAIEKIRMYEAQFSRFLADSELSILNRDKDMPVTETFMQVTQKAYELFTRTKGIFNPLVQIERLGYTKNFDDINTDEIEEDTQPYNIDFTTTRIDPLHQRVTLTAGQKLDFGGFLKGYLAELLAK